MNDPVTPLRASPPCQDLRLFFLKGGGFQLPLALGPLARIAAKMSSI